MVMVLKNLMDAVVGDREVVSDAEHVGDGDCASASALAEVEYPIFEIIGIVCVGSASQCLQLWSFPVLTVCFGELLDPPTTYLELLGN